MAGPLSNLQLEEHHKTELSKIGSLSPCNLKKKLRK